MDAFDVTASIVVIWIVLDIAVVSILVAAAGRREERVRRSARPPRPRALRLVQMPRPRSLRFARERAERVRSRA